ncbi:MAG: hypothetical protein AAF206_23025 [Bacteroidota bacterium]
MKKIIAREFLWLLVVLMLAVPISRAAMALITHFSNDLALDSLVKVSATSAITYIFSLLGIYLSRGVVIALKVLSSHEKEKEES